jgi:AcrR family transcriptional regulator
MKEKSFERKDELIAAAFDEFTLKSYENASLNNIIKTAGISKGTFYYNFENKMELYLSMIEIAGRNQVEFINKHIKEQNVEAKDIFEELKLQFQMSGKFAITHPKYYKFIIMFVKEIEINKDLKSAFADSNDSLLDVLIKKAIKNGDFNNRFSIDFIKKIMQYLFTNYFGIFIEEEDYELEKMLENANNFVDFIKYGLGDKEE